MNKLKLVSALIISLSIGIIYAKDIQNINDQAEEIIYRYAEIIDSKNFSELKSIMQTNFKMTGMYEIDSLEEFMFAMQELDKNFIQTCTLLGTSIHSPLMFPIKCIVCIKFLSSSCIANINSSRESISYMPVILKLVCIIDLSSEKFFESIISA